MSAVANRTLSESVPNCVVKSLGLNSIPGQAIKKSLTQMGSTVNASVAIPPGTLWQLFGAQLVANENKKTIVEFQVRVFQGLVSTCNRKDGAQGGAREYSMGEV